VLGVSDCSDESVKCITGDFLTSYLFFWLTPKEHFCLMFIKGLHGLVCRQEYLYHVATDDSTSVTFFSKNVCQSELHPRAIFFSVFFTVLHGRVHRHERPYCITTLYSYIIIWIWYLKLCSEKWYSHISHTTTFREDVWGKRGSELCK
jgi:hypothetical protein